MQWLAKPSHLVAVALVSLVAACHLWVNPSNPPGFHQDEAAIAVNAFSIAETGRDEHGAWMPLFFRSYGDYKSPEFVYLLAGVFRVTGPSQAVARGLSAVLILAAVVALAVLAYRRSASGRVGVAMFLLAGTTAWLFELGRLAWEVTLEPLVLVLLLLLLERCHREDRWTTRRGVLAGLALAAITYSYAGGRLYGPVVALCVPLATGIRRGRFVAVVWGSFAATLVPLGAYVLRHPGALSERFDYTTFIRDDMSATDVVRTGVENYIGYFDLPHWVLHGDPTITQHVPGTGSLPLVVALLAIAGLARLLLRSELDGFWRFTLAATLLGPVPAALTTSDFHSLRALPLVIGLLTFSIPALQTIDRAVRERRRWAVPTVVALAAVWLGWVAQFVRTYEARGPDRRLDEAVPVFIAEALARERILYVPPGDLVALTHARWFQDVHDVPRDRVVMLPPGARPPAGSLVLGTKNECRRPCTVVRVVGSNWLARAS